MLNDFLAEFAPLLIQGTIKICNNVAVLEHGRVVEQGSVAKVFADPQAEATRVLLGKVDWDA